jgi:hypothetical protein
MYKMDDDYDFQQYAQGFSQPYSPTLSYNNSYNNTSYNRNQPLNVITSSPPPPTSPPPPEEEKKARGRKKAAATTVASPTVVPEREVRIREFDLNDLPPNGPDDHKNGVKIVVIGKPGCFAAGTQVLMYDGSLMNIEDVQIGDQVMGDNNTPRTVLELFRDEDEMFEIKPKFGESYIVNRLHDLVLKSNGTCSEYPADSIVEISVRNYLEMPQMFKDSFWVMRSSGVDCWKDPKITVDAHELGLDLVKSFDFIPNAYKICSVDRRKKLLRGVLESSFVFNDKNHQYELTTATTQLLEDIAFVARSIGIRAKIVDNANKLILYGQRVKNICNDEAFDQADETDLCSFEVIPQGRGQYYGFALDGNRRFLLGSFELVKNTGKSVVIQAIMAAKAHIAPVIQVFNGTEDSNGSYGTFCPPACIFDKLDINAMINFQKRQQIAGKHIRDNAWAMQVIDDCTDDPKVFRNPVIQAYYKNGRHWHMIHILSSQYSLDIPPNIRSAIDYVFLMKENTKKNRKKLFENYCPASVETIEDFNALMDECTKDYGALVINNRATSHTLEDQVFYFKADPKAIAPTFRFGHQTAWEFSEERFDPNYIEAIIKE